MERRGSLVQLWAQLDTRSPRPFADTVLTCVTVEPESALLMDTDVAAVCLPLSLTDGGVLEAAYCCLRRFQFPYEWAESTASGSRLSRQIQLAERAVTSDT